MGRKRKKSILRDFGRMGVSLSSLSISTAVGSGIATRAPSGSMNTSGFRTLAGFTPIAITASAGRRLLRF